MESELKFGILSMLILALFIISVHYINVRYGESTTDKIIRVLKELRAFKSSSDNSTDDEGK